MRRINSKLYFLYFFFVFKIAVAQQYNFKNFTPKNGLASSIVNNIFQDSKGYIWFATQGGGVSRFNGKEFKNLTKNDGLVANDVTCIGEDKLGNIWIGTTTDGVSKFDGAKFINYTVKEGLTHNSVYAIYCDASNKVWLGTEGGGISIININNDHIEKITTENGLAGDIVYGITQDKQGSYWFALKDGISTYDGKKIINYENIEALKGKKFWTVFRDSKSVLWFGASNGGVVKYDGLEFHTIDIPKEVSEDFIGSIAEDLLGNMWFGTEHGVMKFDGINYTIFNEKKGLSSNIVFAVTSDYEGNIWIGTQQGGVNFFSNEKFANYSLKEGLLTNKITNIYQIQSNTYIVGTFGHGISILSGNSFYNFNSFPELSQSIISSIAKDNKGNYWIGTGEGIFIIKKSNEDYVLVKSIKKLDNTELPMVTNILQDNLGAMWIATYGRGLFKVDGKKTIRYTAKDGLSSDNILYMFKDSKDFLWLGTNDAGVFKMENEAFINFTESNGLASKSIWTIAEDDKHNMFFGTNEAGISCYDGNKFRTLNIAQGLCSNNITTLMWDKFAKSLVVGTDKGINKLKLRADFEIDSLRFYGEQEGFKGGEVISNAGLIDDEGLIWFGTPEGLYKYDRKYDYPSKIPPILDLNSIHLSYQAVDWKKYTDSVDLRTNIPYNLTLSHENNHLTFYFQALTTSDVKYSYILEGQDKEWSPLSPVSEANFTNIAPGKTYTFKVKAVNNNGIWSEDNISFTFTINPPWWQTWWFYIGSILFLGFGVIGFINYRTAKLAKEKKILEEKVVERTLELNQSNTKLSEAIHAITDSMNYAQRIQQSFLTSEKVLNQSLKDYFILYKPRDIVSGDFYWSYDLPDRTIIACADCTGHGIPGAFMSLIGLSLLNEISHSKGIIEPAKMLDELRRIIILGLNPDQTETGGKDGMDISLIAIMKSNTADEVKIHFAGANSVLCIVTNNVNQKELLEYKGDKQPVGYYSNMKLFKQHEIIAKKDDILYMFTDGYADQFGGPNGKKFMARQLKRVLLTLAGSPTKQQQEKLESTFEDWKGQLEQVDDVTVVGIKLG